MIPLSHRFAPLLLLLLVLALIPVVRHAYVGEYADDCADPQALFDATRIEGAETAREVERQHRGPRFQVTVGRIAKHPDAVRAPRYHVLRTFTPSEFYMQPTYHLHGDFEAERHELEWIEVGDERLPIFWQFGRTDGRPRVVGLMYVYRSRPTQHPFRAQLASAYEQLVHGTRPLTLFIASGYAPKRKPERVQEPARRWFAAAWRYYESVCSH